MNASVQHLASVAADAASRWAAETGSPRFIPVQICEIPQRQLRQNRSPCVILMCVALNVLDHALYDPSSESVVPEWHVRTASQLDYRICPPAH